MQGGVATTARAGRRLGVSKAIASAVPLIIVLILLIPAGPRIADPSATSAVPSSVVALAATPPPSTLVWYNASSDGWNLSFQEWLPTGYRSGTPYPLAVYLHGELGTNASWLVGGTYRTPLGAQTWGPGFIQSARSHGFLLIGVNTRSLSGFYINSPFSGPQEQDTLDAIALEEARRNVSGVYLFGDSMGSVGSLDLAAHHAGLVRGVGVIASCGDLFEALQWRSSQKLNDSIAEILQPSGGLWPNQSAWANSMFFYLSASRYYPQNLTGLRLYYADGGGDKYCPNNAATSAYQQANNTVLRGTCAVATRMAEPPNCTSSLAVLSGDDPVDYVWRYDYVAAGLHSGGIANPDDMFAFWLGQVPGGLVCGAPGGKPTPCARPGNPSGPFTTQYFASSVDGHLLSYYEWLPASYNPSHSYPLLLYLHGKGGQGNQIYSDPAGLATIHSALADGFLVAAFNTRDPGGFYVNSPFTGPQEQDLLDAISHEKHLRPVTTLWVFGVSMGTMGAYSLAEHHPGLVRGIGVIASCSDLYQVQSYKISVNRSADFAYFLNTTGGYLANQSAYAASETYYLSAFRFYPQNLSGVRLYVVQGGNDLDCPNNPNVWGFQMANNTILNSTCLTASALNEPASCTVPFQSLAAASPAKYHYRYVYESTGGHTLDLLDPADMLGYFLGVSSDGLYWASPGGDPYVPPG